MLFISGTKRSGTSMWMQVMRAAGLPILGEAFPRNWGTFIRDANPEGFFESFYREGIYWRTNPHPTKGTYLASADVAGYACKVFVPGVVRSERAYIEHVVANLRPWRAYAKSLSRLTEMERAGREGTPQEQAPAVAQMPAHFEWWMENFALIRDASIRRYPLYLQTYDEVVQTPRETVTRLFGRMKLKGDVHVDVDAAAEAIKPEHRHFTPDDPADATDDAAPDLKPAHVEVFDRLYEVVAAHEPISGPLLKDLNNLNRELLPLLAALVKKRAETGQARSAFLKERGIQSKPLK